MASDRSGSQSEKWRDPLGYRGIVQGGGERGPRIERPRADDAGGALHPDSREGADRREWGAVHVERVLDCGQRSLAVARHAHIDESIQRHVVREADEDRIRADLSAIRHVAVLNLQEHVPENRAFRDHSLQHLMVNRGPHGLLESPELAIEAGRLELAAHGAHLPDVDPADPYVVRHEPLQQRRLQGGRLDPPEQLVDRRYVYLRGLGGPQADRLVTEEVRLSSETEIHRAELGESTDLSQDAGHRPELRLAVHRLDAERAALVEISDTA